MEPLIEYSYEFRLLFGCKVCGNPPDCSGQIEHGRGCYTQDEDGGGDSWVEIDQWPMLYKQWIEETT